jgi:hypothetical protein
MFDPPPLINFHPDSHLIPGKPAEIDRLSKGELKQSLVPGQKDCLKTRPDGTILDGHHRIHILRKPGVNVEVLPREIVMKGNL